MVLSAHDILIFLLQSSGPVVRNYMLKIFSEPRKPKCYASAAWEPLGGEKSPPVLKLTFDIINASDDPVEIVEFSVSHPTGVEIVESLPELVSFIYERGPKPKLAHTYSVNEELDGQKYAARNPAERQEGGRREYSFYCLPEDDGDALFSVARLAMFTQNIVAFVVRYKHADEMGRIRKMTVATDVPDFMWSPAQYAQGA